MSQPPAQQAPEDAGARSRHPLVNMPVELDDAREPWWQDAVEIVIAGMVVIASLGVLFLVFSVAKCDGGGAASERIGVEHGLHD